MSEAGTYRMLPMPASWGSVIIGLEPQVGWSCASSAPLISGTVEEMLSVLKVRDREVVIRRVREETLDSIGADLGVTRERVRQIEMSAIRTLRVDLGSPWQSFVEWFESLAPCGGLAMSINTDGPIELQAERTAWDVIAYLARKASRPSLRCEWLSKSRLLLRDPKRVKSDTIDRWLRQHPRFLELDTVENATGIDPGLLNCAGDFFDGLLMVRAKKFGSAHWTLAQLAEAVAWELAFAGISEFHFSQLGQAMAAVQPARLANTSPRNFAALLSRSDQSSFVQAPESGFWRLKAPPERDCAVPREGTVFTSRPRRRTKANESDGTQETGHGHGLFHEATKVGSAPGSDSEDRLVDQVFRLLSRVDEAMTPHQVARALGSERMLVHLAIYRELLPNGMVTTPDGRRFKANTVERASDD